MNGMQAVEMARDAVAALSTLQRAGLATIGVATLAALAWLSFGDFEGAHRVVEKDLPDAAAASELAGRLRAAGLKPRLADGGRTVEVRDADLALALRVAGERPGLARRQGSIASELAKKNAMSLTEPERKVLASRAIEARVEESLETYEMVRSASVSISQPPEHGFADERGAVKASVILCLKPGTAPGRELLRTIRSTVSNAVNGLRPENISISDSRGTDLGETQDEAAGRARADSEPHFALQQLAEREMHQKVLALLEPLFGRENLSVSVTARLRAPRPAAFRRATRETPGAATARTVSLGSALAPEAPMAPMASLDAVTDNDGPELAQLAVSVLINSSSLSGGQLPETVRKCAETAVLTAVGHGPGRRDLVTIVGAPFRQAAPPPLRTAVAASAVGDLLTPWAGSIWVGGTGLLLLMLLGALRFNFPRPIAHEAAAPDLPVHVASAAPGELTVLLGLSDGEVRELLESDTRRDLAVLLAATRPPLRDFVMEKVPADDRELLGAQVAFMQQPAPDEVFQAKQRLYDRLHPIT